MMKMKMEGEDGLSYSPRGCQLRTVKWTPTVKRRLKVDEGFSWTVGRILVRRVCKFSWNVPVNRPLTHGGSVQQNKAKTTMANHKRPATESSPTAPAAK